MHRRDFLTISITDEIATMWIDHQGERVNKIDAESISLIENILEELDRNPLVKALVIISKKKDFMAGVDIDFIERVRRDASFPHIGGLGQISQDRLENSKKPVVVAIHGRCIGSGLEIAIACRSRIATKHHSTIFTQAAIPVGLIPSAGGTQRLPRLIGIQKAADIILSGRVVDSSEALRIGLVDKLVEPESLYEEALIKAKELIHQPLVKRKSNKSVKDWLLENTKLGRIFLFKIIRKKILAANSPVAHAQLRAIDCMELGYTKGKAAGAMEEVKAFHELLYHPTTVNLCNLYLQVKKKKKNPFQAEKPELKTLAIVGAGFMGAGIAEISILAQKKVLLLDNDVQATLNVKKKIEARLEKKVSQGIHTTEEAKQIAQQVQVQTDYAAFRDADIVIEAVFENLELKKKVLAAAEENTQPHCIFASNTSALPITQLAQAAKRPEQVIGLHYFSPVHKMPLLEIVKAPTTADWVVASCVDLGIAQGKTCIVVNDGPGFYTTRILAPMLHETLLLLEEGADILQIDKAMQQFGFPVGPVTLLDEVGIDVGASIMSGNMMQEFIGKRSGEKISNLLEILHSQGYKGRKNKKGFYQYDEQGIKIQGMVDKNIYQILGEGTRRNIPFATLQDRCAFAMLNEAAYCLQEHILQNPSDGDLGAMLGLSFPAALGGPFTYIDNQGIYQIVKKLENLAATHGNRFSPAAILLEKAEKGEKFHL